MTPGAQMVPHIEGLAYVPLAMLGKEETGLVKKLTIKPRGFQGKVVAPIETFSYDKTGYLGMPIDFAINRFENLVFEDRTVQGGECYYNKLPDPHHPNAAPGQAQFMQEMDYAAANYFTFIAKAPTGSGKTAVALRTAALRGRKTLIVVPSEQLARQWSNAIVQHLGIPMDDIGWVQSNTMGLDHPFVIAIVHSVAGRRYVPEFYSAFGTVIFDEVHRMGAAFFAQAVALFSSNLKIGLTATDRRKDGADPVFLNYFGIPKVVGKTVIRPCTINVLDYEPHQEEGGTSVPHYMENSGLILGVLTTDRARNDLCLRIITKMYDKGRTILAIGDRTKHLQDMGKLCEIAGIPSSEIGYFVEQLYTDETKPSFEKLKSTKPNTIAYFWGKDDEQLEYKQPLTIVRALGQSIEVKDDKGIVYACSHTELRTRVMVPKKVSVPQDELDRIKRESVIVFATYGMFKEGQDIARLNAGIDLTPRADGEQAIGRIRRPYPGAPDAVWYTIADQGHPTLKRWTNARIRDYQTAGARIVRHGRVG